VKKEFIDAIASKLSGRSLVVASAREPYAHSYEGDEIVLKKNSGGVVTALDPLMKALKGSWVAFGSGEADREAVNAKNEFKVETREGGYTLKRVFLEKGLEDGFLNACNGAIWPLSHMVFIRPAFVDEEWEAYKQANRQMASAIAEVCGDDDVVWINDYQLALVAGFLKKLKPKVTTAFFWHIPWPSASAFKVFPWADEFLESLLAYDIIGFHTQYYAANFLNSVDSSLESKVDRASFSIQYQGSITEVTSSPISVDYDGIREKVKGMSAEEANAVLKKYGVKKGAFAIGVDRMDYTKGIREKILAVDFLLKKNGEYKGKFTLLQIASPTRLHIQEYQQAAKEAAEAAEDVNWEHSDGKWKPVVFLNEFADYEEILALYSAASFCMVNSLHDGMNLVCKEYVSASEDGALVLSKFTGAALELNGSLLVNPYSLSDIASAMESALKMDRNERNARMEKMREEVRTNDVFHWASKFVSEIEKVLRRKG